MEEVPNHQPRSRTRILLFKLKVEDGNPTAKVNDRWLLLVGILTLDNTSWKSLMSWPKWVEVNESPRVAGWTT